MAWLNWETFRDQNTQITHIVIMGTVTISIMSQTLPFIMMPAITPTRQRIS